MKQINPIILKCAGLEILQLKAKQQNQNKLKADTLKMDALVTAPSPKTYQIKSGDTLSKIAQRFNVSITALQQANPQIKDNNLIYTGHTLIIPGTPNRANTPSPALQGKLPTTKELSESQKYDLYTEYINQFGTSHAHNDLTAGKKVVLSLRNDTNIRANNGKGLYDDRLVVVWKDPNDRKRVAEFSANTDPSGQYEPGGPYMRRAVGADYNSDGRGDMGRLKDGTYRYTRGLFQGKPAYRATGDQVTERDTNHNGQFDDNVTTPRKSYGMHIHVGGTSNTYSAGCFTMAPDDFKHFLNILDKQDSLYNVVVNTRSGFKTPSQV